MKCSSYLRTYLVLLHDYILVVLAALDALLAQRNIPDSQALFINHSILGLLLPYLNSALVSFTRFEKLLCLNSDLISDFLGAGGFISEPLDAVLKQLRLFY
jgi:hypothetical protein